MPAGPMTSLALNCARGICHGNGAYPGNALLLLSPSGSKLKPSSFVHGVFFVHCTVRCGGLLTEASHSAFVFPKLDRTSPYAVLDVSPK